MNVTIPAAAEEFVRRKVESGEFGSADEVVREGLRLLQEQDQQWSAEAKRKIDEGWTQAKDGPLRTPEQVRENLAARKEAWKAARGPE
jgi:antitoxin ParD1/3/4